MTTSHPDAVSAPGGLPVLLFDGDCAFCTTCVRWAARRIRPAAPMIPWQRADLTALGINEQRCRESIQWVTAPGTAAESGAAVAALLGSGGTPWPLAARILRMPGVRVVADAAYRWVAAHRHRLPGATPACRLAPDHQGFTSVSVPPVQGRPSW